MVEYIDQTKGTMLSSSWELKKNDTRLRTNLFKGLSRILLDMAKVPVPRLGSFAINSNGFLALSNRPRLPIITEMEAKQIPVDIPRDTTYSLVDSFVTDLLAIHDSRFTHQPNALSDRIDGHVQAAALTAMRTVATCFFKLRRGPFVYVVNDLHQSNILVDENWNIKYLIDLEFACSRPIEMVHPPHWFTNRYVDKINVDHFALVHQEFMNLMEQQEKELYADTDTARPVSTILKKGLENNTFWYSLGLTSITGLYHIFFNNIEKIFTPEVNEDDPYFIKVMHSFWTLDIDRFIAKKVEDKAVYDRRLQEEFDVDPAS